MSTNKGRFRMSWSAKSLFGTSVLSLMMMMIVFLWTIIHSPAVEARAILGVDLGSLYMKVALVQSGSPLEIVTNLHSKRKTEQMVLFDRAQRFYGADASSLLARKSHQTPQIMSVMLGRDDQHPMVQVLAERHYPLRPVYNETRAGVTIPVDGIHFTPEELVAMVLSHAVDISVAHSASQGSQILPPSDCVLTVPSFATQHERRALLDAAALADLKVLTLLDENTAAALHYAMDKTFAEGEQLLLFYNMGASALQVSLIRFFAYDQPQKYGKPKSVPALEVLAKAWDETCGGLAFDHLIVEYMAEQFNAAYHKAKPDQASFDIRTVPRAMIKLAMQANKIKHVLSANSDFPIYIEAVHDDLPLSTHLTRDHFEELAHDLIKRAIAPIHKVLQLANKTLAQDVTGMELIGGGMRIPRVQTALQEVLGENLTLGLHMNADESMALGAAFAGANISTAFRVRHVGVTDINPFAMAVTLTDLPPSSNASDEKSGGRGLFGLGGGKKKKDEEKDAGKKDEEGEDAAVAAAKEPWNKKATIFKALGKMGVKKTLAFTHDRDVHCALDYEDDANEGMLPKGTEHALERYNITGVADFAQEMAEKGLGKPKVTLQFELTHSGITSLVRAEATVEETYMAQEEVEVDDVDEVNATEASNATTEAANETKTADPSKESASENATDEASDVNETVKSENATSEKSSSTKNKTDASKPKKKRITVEKEKKRLHRKTLSVDTYYVGRVQPHSPEVMAASKAKLVELALLDKERMMLEESRNRVESYIYRIKNTLEDRAEELEKVSTEEQREEAQKLAQDANDWLDDEGYGADLKTMDAKYKELSDPFEKIMLRVSEHTARPKAVESLQKRLTEIEALMVQWETTRPQVTDEERARVLEKVEAIRTWVEEKEAEQSKKQPHEDPAFLSTDLPEQLTPVQSLVLRLSKKPKPKEEKKAKNETASENATSTKANASAAEGNETQSSAEDAGYAESATDEAKAGKEENATDGSNTTSPDGNTTTEGDDEL